MAKKKDNRELVHIGYAMTMCGLPVKGTSLRPDFSLKQILEYCKQPPFKDAKPVRLCKRCKKSKQSQEKNYTKFHNRRTKNKNLFAGL